MSTGFKLATYDSGKGARAGLVVGEKIIDIADTTGNAWDADVLALLQNWDVNLKRLDAAVEKGRAAAKPLSSVKLLAPIPSPKAIYCAGANYHDHSLEMARAQGKPDPVDPHTLGLRSWHFLKVSHCVTAPGATVKLPSPKVDWEVELTFIIGRTARNVAEKDALDYVMGYTVSNDLSARDIGVRMGYPADSPFRTDWLGHKVFDGSCPMGPWITLARDVGDPHKLRLGLDVNDVRKQDSNTSELIFNINEQVADLSRLITLYPGDVILTGTPAGCGARRGEFLKPSDKVRAWIDNLGEIENTMA